MIENIYQKQILSREEIISYLKSKARNFGSDEERNREIAYEIAGMMSIESVRKLDARDPIVEVMSLAGELELPKELATSKDATWENLKNKIISL